MKLRSFILSLTLFTFAQTTFAIKMADIEKYSPGIGKIALGSALLGLASSEGLIIRQFWQDLLAAHKYYLQSGAFNSKYLGSSIGATLVPVAVAATFIGSAALGSALIIKGTKEILDA